MLCNFFDQDLLKTFLEHELNVKVNKLFRASDLHESKSKPVDLFADENKWWTEATKLKKLYISLYRPENDIWKPDYVYPSELEKNLLDIMNSGKDNPLDKETLFPDEDDKDSEFSIASLGNGYNEEALEHLVNLFAT